MLPFARIRSNYQGPAVLILESWCSNGYLGYLMRDGTLLQQAIGGNEGGKMSSS